VPLQDVSLVSDQLLLLDHHTHVFLWSGSKIAGKEYDETRQKLKDIVKSWTVTRFPAPVSNLAPPPRPHTHFPPHPPTLRANEDAIPAPPASSPLRLATFPGHVSNIFPKSSCFVFPIRHSKMMEVGRGAVSGDNGACAWSGDISACLRRSWT